MVANPIRVVVWSTGGVGSIAIDAIRCRPDLELVGVLVHSPEKVGRDAGELANGAPISVAATNDADALIALRPDCAVYAASGPGRDARAVPDYLRLLEAGINVVSTTSTGLIYPSAYFARSGVTSSRPRRNPGTPRSMRRGSSRDSRQISLRSCCRRSRRLSAR